MVNVVRLLAGLYEENAYLCWREGEGLALLVDPGDQADMLIADAKGRGLDIGAILLTHGHFDHIMALPELIEKTDAKIWIHARDERLLSNPYPLKLPPEVQQRFVPTRIPDDRKLAGVSLTLCNIVVEMIETPGHSPGGACFYLPGDKILFSGDTLFKNGYGRTDFANSRDMDMRASLVTLFKMDADIEVYPGHGDGDRLGNIKRRFGL